MPGHVPHVVRVTPQPGSPPVGGGVPDDEVRVVSSTGEERLVGGDTSDWAGVEGEFPHLEGLEQGVGPDLTIGQPAVEEALGRMETATFDAETSQHLVVRSQPQLLPQLCLTSVLTLADRDRELSFHPEYQYQCFQYQPSTSNFRATY